jgi:hypothetical protein
MDRDPAIVPEERRKTPAFLQIYEEPMGSTTTFSDGTVVVGSKAVKAGPCAIVSKDGRFIGMKPE